MLDSEQEMDNKNVCLFYLGENYPGNYRTGAVKKFKNLVIQTVLIQGILEDGFACLSERVFSFVPTDGGSWEPGQGALSLEMRREHVARASGRPT